MRIGSSFKPAHDAELCSVDRSLLVPVAVVPAAVQHLLKPRQAHEGQSLGAEPPVERKTDIRSCFCCTDAPRSRLQGRVCARLPDLHAPLQAHRLNSLAPANSGSPAHTHLVCELAISRIHIRLLFSRVSGGFSAVGSPMDHSCASFRIRIERRSLHYAFVWSFLSVHRIATQVESRSLSHVRIICSTHSK